MIYLSSLLLALTRKFYFAKEFNYTVYFENCWGLNTSQTEYNFLIKFSYSRSFAVLFLVKNFTSE